MLPYLSNIPVQNSIAVDSFKGINVREDISLGECVSCSDVAPSSYPVISSRKKRSLHSECDGIINGVGSFDGFFYTYYKENPKEIYLSFGGKDYPYKSFSEESDYTLRRQFATLENAIMIIPDNVVFHTDTKVFERINVRQSANSSTMASKFYAEGLVTGNFDYKTIKEIGYITSKSIYANSRSYTYSGSTRQFYTLTFNTNFKVGDVVRVKADVVSPSSEITTGYTNFVKRMKEEGFSAKIKSITSKSHNTPKGFITEITELVFDSGEVYTGGYTDVYFTSITIERQMPQVSCITSFNNRIWAVGGANIYSSRLASPTEWNDFSVDSQGTVPSASFSTSAGTQGSFTAIIPHGNYIYAFKENHIHKIYGDTPDEYRVTGIEAQGCIKNSFALAVCGLYLIYASNDGICILREGYPKIISRKIGRIIPVCAAARGNLYYLLCSEGKGRVIYVYDLEHDLWTKQSCGENADFLCSDGEDICVADGGKLIYLTKEDGEEYERKVRWNFRLRFDRSVFGDNTAIRVLAKINLGKNASYTAYAIYDDDTRGAVVGECFDETHSGNSVLRLPVKRDSGFSIEFKGVGDFTMKSIKFTYYKPYQE